MLQPLQSGPHAMGLDQSLLGGVCRLVRAHVCNGPVARCEVVVRGRQGTDVRRQSSDVSGMQVAFTGASAGVSIKHRRSLALARLRSALPRPVLTTDD